MEEESHPASSKLEELALGDSPKALEEFVGSLSVSETARALADLSTEAQTNVITTLQPEDAARIVESIPESQAAEIVSNLAPEQAAAIINNVESDEQADILSKLSDKQTEEILSEMDAKQAFETRQRIDYPQHSAGGIMVTEFLSFQQELLIKDVIEELRDKIDTFSDHAVQYVFVVSRQQELKGVLRLRDLVLSSVNTAIKDIMIKDPVSIFAEADLQELENIFDRFRFLGVPVVDSFNRIVGVVRRADVEEAVGESFESDYLKASGILGGEELRSMPLLGRSGRRLSWLSVNIILNVLAASIISYYEATLESVIALAVFLPIISDMSGCSGAQAIAVSIRELTLGLVKPAELFRVWRKEVLLGIINGIALGSIIACVAWFWKNNAYLGAVVGTALAINTIVAVSIGGLLPLILKRLNKDPALASGPILTTVTDMCGFFVVLSLAKEMLPYLSPTL